MAIEIKAPAFPESIADGEVGVWHKEEGDSVTRDELVVEIETDKVVMEVLAPKDGVISKIHATTGETILSEQPLCDLEPGTVTATPVADTASSKTVGQAVDAGDIADKAKTTFAPENTASLAIEHASSIAGGELIINGTFSHRSEMYGSADWESYSFETGPNVTMDTHNQLNISGTYKRETASGGTIKVVVYGTDVLDEDGRVSRAYDAGAFAWSELVAGRQFGVTLGYEF